MSSIPPASTFSNAGGVSNASNNENSSLNMQDFMNLLVQQLEHQDPTNPMDASSFFAQMAQLGSVQGIDQMNNQMQVMQAQSLMGKVVTATRPNADGSNGTDTVTGIVTNLSIVNGKYQLGIQDYDGGLVQVNMDAVQSVSSDGNLSQYQGLVGKSVTGIALIGAAGAGTWQSVTGSVTNLFSQNGQNYVAVKQADGTTVNMLVGDIRSITA